MHTTEAHTQTRESLVNAALELVWPTRCAGCERAGELLCASCASKLKYIDRSFACSRCGAPFGSLVCTECYSRDGRLKHSFVHSLCAVSLDELSGRIIVLYKDNNERRLASVLAKMIVDALPDEWAQWADILTWIPVDNKSYRRRGFDHAEAIARLVAEQCALPLHALLKKKPCKDQRRLNREDRINNIRESFSVAQLADGESSNVLLLDDVFTTGSTLEAATLKLMESGVEEVRVVCIARAW